MSITTGVVTKETKETKVGIGFCRNDDAPLTILSIREGSLIAATDLVPGMEVLSINDKSVDDITPKEAASMIRAAFGDIRIEARGVVSKGTKENQDSVVGISLKKDTKSKIITVSSISEDSIFSGTDLRVGQRLLAINGIQCQKSTKDNITFLRDAVGELTVVTENVEAVPDHGLGQQDITSSDSTVQASYKNKIPPESAPTPESASTAEQADDVQGTNPVSVRILRIDSAATPQSNSTY